MKELAFIGTAYADLMAFPRSTIQRVGYQLHLVQSGLMPHDFKTMPSIASGVNEIRITDKQGIYRVIYTAKIADCVYVLHAFNKKTQKTSKQDIEIAKARHKALLLSLQEQCNQNKEG